MYRSSSIIQILLILFFILPACKGEGPENKAHKTEKKFASPTVEKPKDTPKEVRIVSTAPNITEFLFALDLGPHVVGVSKFCNYPKAVENIPKVGGHTDPDLETIIALRPTMVVGVKSSQSPKMEAILSKAKIKSLWLKVESVDDVLAVPLALEKAIPSALGASALSQKMKTALSPLSPTQTPEKVLVVFGMTPMIVAGPDTYVSELVERAGGKNIIEKGPAYPQLDNEKLLTLDPPIIIDVSFGEHAPFPKELHAAKNKKIVKLENLDLMRPSPRIGEMFTFLKKTLEVKK